MPNQKSKISLFTPYFKAKTQERQDEFILCLKENIKCAAIEKIYLLIDDGHVPEVKSSKFEIISMNSRPTYMDWLELSKTKSMNGISVLANTDIYFDDSVSQLADIFEIEPTAFVALSRYEKKGANQILHPNPHWSQDVWAVSNDLHFSQSFKNSLNIPLGVPRCDNKIAYLFAIHGHRIFNPCRNIKTIHVHETNIRGYNKDGDKTILGGTAWVYPSVDIATPSRLQIDVWVLNSLDIAGVKINNTFQVLENNKSTKSSSEPLSVAKEKSIKTVSTPTVIGYDADWQYPAVTEKHAFYMAKKYLVNCSKSEKVIYFGFPWATLIDHSLHNKNDKSTANALMAKLLNFKDQLKKFKKVITVCQHIHMLRFEKLFFDVGVTDIFWSHAVIGQQKLPNYSAINIHPFPLYPVQAHGITGDSLNKKKHLYSFIGARANKYYLTESRNWIIDELNNERRGSVIGRDIWHYNKIVYDHQIRNLAADQKNLVDESASDEFRRTMNESVFSLCPSGTGPNSIRLWESIGFGVIPVVLADTYLPPGNRKLWSEATVSCRETIDDIKTLPDRLESLNKDSELIKRKQHALKQIWMIYGPDLFVYDVIKLFLAFLGEDVGRYEPTDKKTTTLVPDILDRLVIQISEQSNTERERVVFLSRIATQLFTDADSVKQWLEHDRLAKTVFWRCVDEASDPMKKIILNVIALKALKR